MPKTMSLCGGAYYIRWNDGTNAWHNIPNKLANLLNGRVGSRAPGAETLTLGPNGAWFVKFEDGKYRGEHLPAGVVQEIQESGYGDDIKFLALGQEDSFVLQFNSGRRIWSRNIPASMVTYLRNTNKSIEYISLGAWDEWAITYSDGSCAYISNSLAQKKVEAFSERDFLCLDSEEPSFYCVIGNNKCFANGTQELINDLFASRYAFRLLVDEIYFLQDSINYQFQDGSSIYDLAKKLAQKEIDVDIIPKIRVVMDEDDENVYWSLDNRRLWAFKAAGLRSIPVTVIGPNDYYYRLRQQGKGGSTITVRSLAR